MSEKVFMVTEYYTPYKDNNATERECVHLFKDLYKATEFISGVDGNGKLLKYGDRVGIWLKDGCKPEYELAHSGMNALRFKVKEECIADAPLKQGGYVYEVWLDAVEIL